MTAPDLKLRKEDSLLLIIDMQERLAAAMQEEPLSRARRYARALLEAARLFSMPVLLTEQYPRGLGPTLHEIREALPEGTSPIEKTEFSCARVPGVLEVLSALQRRQVIACGMEAHVCVYQTVRDLRAQGFEVHVPADAVCSRSPENARVGLSLMERAGAVITVTETVLFDLLERAGTSEFKAISALIR